MAGRSPGFPEEEAGVFHDEGTIPEASEARASGDLAYPSDRDFVENVAAMRILGASIIALVALPLGVVLAYYGGYLYAAFLLTWGGLMLLYAVALRQGWLRPRWWL